MGGDGEWGSDMAISCLHKRVVVVVGSDTAWWWCWGRVSVVFEVVEVELGGWWWCRTRRHHVRRGGGSGGDAFALWWPVTWPGVGL